MSEVKPIESIAQTFLLATSQQNMTQTGFNWLTGLISRQSEWFQNKLTGWVEFVHGGTDHSADFCSPFYYPLAATIGIGNFFCGAITTFFCWPLAMAKDLEHFSHDPGAAAASLLCITPLYVIFMTILKLLASVGCLLLLIAILFLAIFVALYFGIRYLLTQCLNGVGAVFGRIFGAASR